MQTVVSLLVRLQQQDERLRSKVSVVVNSRRVIGDVMPCYLSTEACWRSCPDSIVHTDDVNSFHLMSWTVLENTWLNCCQVSWACTHKHLFTTWQMNHKHFHKADINNFKNKLVFNFFKHYLPKCHNFNYCLCFFIYSFHQKYFPVTFQSLCLLCIFQLEAFTTDCSGLN